MMTLSSCGKQDEIYVTTCRGIYLVGTLGGMNTIWDPYIYGFHSLMYNLVFVLLTQFISAA